jgi:hypothetical protein
MEGLGVITAQQWRSGTPGVDTSGIASLNITRSVVHLALMRVLHSRWILSYGDTIDPRQGGIGVQLRTHMFWVHKVPADMVLSRDNAPKYMKLCLPLSKLQCLARYRLGGLHLVARAEHGIAVHHRYCPLCSADHSACRAIWRARTLTRCGSLQPEDLLHFILHGPAYDHIRELFPTVFCLPVLSWSIERLYSSVIQLTSTLLYNVFG